MKAVNLRGKTAIFVDPADIMIPVILNGEVIDWLEVDPKEVTMPHVGDPRNFVFNDEDFLIIAENNGVRLVVEMPKPDATGTIKEPRC